MPVGFASVGVDPDIAAGVVGAAADGVVAIKAAGAEDNDGGFDTGAEGTIGVGDGNDSDIDVGTDAAADGGLGVDGVAGNDVIGAATGEDPGVGCDSGTIGVAGFVVVGFTADGLVGSDSVGFTCAEAVGFGAGDVAVVSDSRTVGDTGFESVGLGTTGPGPVGLDPDPEVGPDPDGEVGFVPVGDLVKLGTVEVGLAPCGEVGFVPVGELAKLGAVGTLELLTLDLLLVVKMDLFQWVIWLSLVLLEQ
ncbi:expressed unknown protein [Seminavis robusta]|uniref:Uncharacterized protein n=1 Tax=Seminavis robusta TaxID=568900 RepID=A0A9N8HA49_9STRA|nr:expressed unknown protein [Seminavis robusta]|eukprot:Sro305_g112850.1 n/a (249) ;mRNA; f:64937-65683